MVSILQISALTLIGLGLFAVLTGNVLAQGAVNIDRRTTQGEPEAPQQPTPQAFIDYREDMRTMVQDLAQFARRYNRDFIILPMNGVDLLTKREDGDEDRRVPARTYLQAIDGILQEALFYGNEEVDKERKESELTYLQEWLKKASDTGVNVFVTDYVKDPKKVSDFYAKVKKAGYIGYAAASGWIFSQ